VIYTESFQERKFFHDDSLDHEMSYMRGAPRDNQNFDDDAIALDDNENRDVAAPSPCSTGSRTDMELNSSQVCDNIC
jgi:hypothetical protein